MFETDIGSVNPKNTVPWSTVVLLSSKTVPLIGLIVHLHPDDNVLPCSFLFRSLGPLSGPIKAIRETVNTTVYLAQVVRTKTLTVPLVFDSDEFRLSYPSRVDL